MPLKKKMIKVIKTSLDKFEAINKVEPPAAEQSKELAEGYNPNDSSDNEEQIQNLLNSETEEPEEPIQNEDTYKIFESKISDSEDDNSYSSDDDNQDNVDNSQEIRKKRGRPKKNQNDKNFSKKKRGRKPKAVKMSTLQTNVQEEDNEPMILRLPISLEYIEKIKKSKNDTEDYESINTSIINENISENKNSNEEENKKDLKPRIKQLKLNDYEEELEDRQKCSNCHHQEQNNDVLKKKIISLEVKIKSLEKDLHATANIDYMGSKAIRTALNFISIENGKQNLAEKTNIACFYDTCKFDSPPCYLPEKYIDDKFYVSKCFCSWNCVLRYNFELNDNKMWTRHKLILMIVKIMYNIDDLEPSPERGTLIKFGGHLTITEFRNSSLINLKSYRIIEPPMVTLLPIIEENYKKNNGYLPNLTEDMLIRKRTKPLPKSRNNIGDKFGIKQE